MFVDKFKLTSNEGLPVPKFSPFAKKPPWNGIAAGLYNNGVVTIFDRDFNDSFLSSWSWLIGDKALLVGGLCWGDFIYACSTEKKFFIVLVNQFTKHPIGNSLSAVFDMNIASIQFENDLLRLNEFEKCRTEVGNLKYGEFYGFSSKINGVEKREMSLSLDILGQTGRQLHLNNKN